MLPIANYCSDESDLAVEPQKYGSTPNLSRQHLTRKVKHKHKKKSYESDSTSDEGFRSKSSSLESLPNLASLSNSDLEDNLQEETRSLVEVVSEQNLDSYPVVPLPSNQNELFPIKARERSNTIDRGAVRFTKEELETSFTRLRSNTTRNPNGHSSSEATPPSGHRRGGNVAPGENAKHSYGRNGVVQDGDPNSRKRDQSFNSNVVPSTSGGNAKHSYGPNGVVKNDEPHSRKRTQSFNLNGVSSTGKRKNSNLCPNIEGSVWDGFGEVRPDPQKTVQTRRKSAITNSHLRNGIVSGRSNSYEYDSESYEESYARDLEVSDSFSSPKNGITGVPSLGTLSRRSSILDANHSDSILWNNHWEFGNQNVWITNGSLLSFSGSHGVSRGIRKQTKKQNNPLAVSHVGIALVGTPNEMYRLINQSMQYGGLRFNSNQPVVARACEYMQSLLSEMSGNVPDVFCLHSIAKYGVHIAPLCRVIDEYDGHVYARALDTAIPLENMIKVITSDLGLGYNFNIREFVRCVNDKNKKTNNAKLFCSQLVAHIYKDCGLIQRDIVTTNVTPAEFGSACNDDLLRDHARTEVPLKVKLDNDGCGCFCF
jgi:hypothetical protein